jgi:hypothetical protein
VVGAAVEAVVGGELRSWVGFGVGAVVGAVVGSRVVALIGTEGLTAIMSPVRANFASIENVILVKASSSRKSSSLEFKYFSIGLGPF